MWDHTVSVSPATRQKQTRPPITPAMQAGTRFTYPGARYGRLSWPSWLDSAPAGSRTNDLSITSPTPNHCTKHWSVAKSVKSSTVSEIGRLDEPKITIAVKTTLYPVCGLDYDCFHHLSADIIHAYKSDTWSVKTINCVQQHDHSKGTGKLHDISLIHSRTTPKNIAVKDQRSYILIAVNSLSQQYRVSLAIWHHTVLPCHQTQVNTPRLNPNQTVRYWIYLSRMDRRLKS